MTKLDPAETIFLKFISEYTSENLRDAITMDFDLGKLVIEEFGADYLAEGRRMASLYDTMHPGKRNTLNDPMESARKILAFLKLQRPDLGYEIETYISLPTATTVGLVLVGDNSMSAPVQQEHVGMSWLARNIVSLAQVLLG